MTWQEIIDERLPEFGQDSDRFDDDGLEQPSEEIIRLAIALAEKLKIKGYEPPARVTVDPNGGIVFEWRQGDVSTAYHVRDDGKIEYQRYLRAKLVERWDVTELQEPLSELLSRVRASILKLNEYVEYLESGYDTIFTDLQERATFLNVISCDFEELANRLGFKLTTMGQ